MMLLKDRGKRDMSAEEPKFPKTHFMNTAFYPKLAETNTGYTYANVRRWTTYPPPYPPCPRPTLPIPFTLTPLNPSNPVSLTPLA